MLCNALKQPLSLQSSSQNLLLVSSLPVFRNRNERNLNLPYHRSSTRNRFEQILPRNLSNLGKASLSLYPVFCLLRSSSARMKIEIAGIYYPQANIGNCFWQYYSFYAEEVCGACLAMKSSTAVSLCKVNEPSNRMQRCQT